MELTFQGMSERISNSGATPYALHCYDMPQQSSSTSQKTQVTCAFLFATTVSQEILLSQIVAILLSL